ncbi:MULTISPECIES: hypothetical protein [unclassified Paenibacillus]|uniref:hypothetical protein n=1 Tax=unclassified Paenibacillus TaxID=185978 RepID=UPI0029016128|nr:hypothetical protein [Paenibacillus sp.]MDU2240640.1 hypothetical protein [Paenibacillus sp.]
MDRYSKTKFRRDGMPKKLAPFPALLQEAGETHGANGTEKVQNFKKNLVTEGALIVASELNRTIETLTNEVTDLRRDLDLKPNIKVVKKKSSQ